MRIFSLVIFAPFCARRLNDQRVRFPSSKRRRKPCPHPFPPELYHRPANRPSPITTHHCSPLYTQQRALWHWTGRRDGVRVARHRVQFGRTKGIDHRQSSKSPYRLASCSTSPSLVRRDEGSRSPDVDGTDGPRKPRKTEGRRELYVRKDDGWVRSWHQAGARVAETVILVVRTA